MNQSIDCGLARNTDPSTSHKAAKVRRTSLRDRIVIAMGGGYYEPRPEGWTGKELAQHLDCPLNSITPRFAELVKAIRIKDTGQRRDGQIVWGLA